MCHQLVACSKRSIYLGNLMPVSSQAIMRTVPDTGMVDFIIVAAIWRAQNIVQEFERLPKWGEISAVPPICRVVYMVHG